MYIFKTSAETYESVIKNQKHAFRGKPKDWKKGELILVSKNKSGLQTNEKQISYTMLFDIVRRVHAGETELLWPGNEGRWNYIVECTDAKKLPKPFDLDDVLGLERAKRYGPIITSGKIIEEDAEIIFQRIDNNKSDTSKKIVSEHTNLQPNSENKYSKTDNESVFWLVVPLIILSFLLGAFLF